MQQNASNWHGGGDLHGQLGHTVTQTAIRAVNLGHTAEQRQFFSGHLVQFFHNLIF